MLLTYCFMEAENMMSAFPAITTLKLTPGKRVSSIRTSIFRYSYRYICWKSAASLSHRKMALQYLILVKCGCSANGKLIFVFSCLLLFAGFNIRNEPHTPTVSLSRNLNSLFYDMVKNRAALPAKDRRQNYGFRWSHIGYVGVGLWRKHYWKTNCIWTCDDWRQESTGLRKSTSHSQWRSQPTEYSLERRCKTKRIDIPALLSRELIIWKISILKRMVGVKIR